MAVAVLVLINGCKLARCSIVLLKGQEIEDRQSFSNLQPLSHIYTILLGPYRAEFSILPI